MEEAKDSPLVERCEWLKTEIRSFLDDKQLLRQLEESTGPEATVLSLLRASILAKSASVKAMVAELR